MNKLSTWLYRPVKARHVKKTYVFSPDDDVSQPSRHLLELSLEAAKAALDVDLPDVSARMDSSPKWPDLWPGEHYRLLAALVKVLQPRRVLEVGTFTGLSSLSMKKHLKADAKLHTFDVIPWDKIPHTCLRREDFADGRLEQVIADLGDPSVLAQHRDKFLDATLIFVDGPKDNVFEPRFLDNLQKVSCIKSAYMVFDDIKDRNMLEVWRSIRWPKLDITSFAHWTGTGIVHWTGNGSH